MHRIWSPIAACVASGCAIAFPTAPVIAQNVGFIFSGDQAVSAADKRQYISVGEKLSIPELRRRFPSYSVSPVESDCGGTCASIEDNKGTYIRISYGDDFYNISSGARSSRDTLGNAVGTPLRKAIGANTTNCDPGDETTCDSVLIKGLSYIVGGCSWKTGVIPACATVKGFEISRYMGQQH
jgi:hypothetical protein